MTLSQRGQTGIDAAALQHIVRVQNLDPVRLHSRQLRHDTRDLFLGALTRLGWSPALR